MQDPGVRAADWAGAKALWQARHVALTTDLLELNCALGMG